jgi:multiple sugar transport system permease protein
MALVPMRATALPGEARREDRRRVWQRTASGLSGPLFVLPAMLVLALVLVFPLVYVILTSFQGAGSSPGLRPTLANYTQLLQDARFGTALWNTVVFTVVSVVFHLLLGVAAALLVHRPVVARAFFRIALLAPWTVAPVVVGVVWKWMYNAQFGIINDVLLRLGVLSEGHAWLGDATFAMPALVLANVWRGFPFIMIVALAGLQAIPIEQYEAAAVDGATSVQQFRYVTLPNLQYILYVSGLLDTIWMFRHFDLVQVMTAGGPAGATDVLSTLIFRTSFEYLQFPYASAMAVAMFAALFVLMMVYLRAVLRSQS